MAGAANNVSETDHSLAIQCMELTKHLANQGKSFKLSLSLQTGFNFSLDVTQEQLSPSSVERKKPSPSTLKRNALRKKTFLQKKNLEKLAGSQQNEIQISSEDKMIKCNQCDSRFECNNTLEYHIKENHSQELTCEECGFSVNTANSMKEHMIEKHRIEQINENPESIEQLDGHIEIKKTEDKEIEIVRTAEQRKIHSDFIRKYVFSSVVDKFNYEMVCYKCNKNFTKKPDFKKHMQDDHNKEIFIDL